MIPTAFAIPGDLDQPTGGYAYDRRVLALLGHFGVAVRHLALPGSFPHPTPEDLVVSEGVLTALGREGVLLVDGLAYGALPARLIRAIRPPIVALVHHPLGFEAGLSPARQAELLASERAALALAQRVLTTSATTARALAADFAVAPARIAVAAPGTDPAPRAHGSAGGPLQLLAVGAVVARKAYDVLLRALEPLAALPWQLTIAGPLDRSAAALAQLERALAETGLAPRVTLVGAKGAQELELLYAGADVFVLASLYEGYGMVLGEAMARGLAIVCTTGGAAAETVPDHAALKVPPGEVAALGAAIGRILRDADLRRQLAAAAWAAGQRLPRWEATAAAIAAVIRELAP
jgi:glycosyltransferase involved in cell wall biosynthesis